MNQYMTSIEATNKSCLPINHHMCRLAKIREIIDEHLDWREDNTKVSPGVYIESLVSAIMTNRKPLWKMHEFWTERELKEYYPALAENPSCINDDAYGRALDKLVKCNPMRIIGDLSFSLAVTHDVEINTAHLDTTSVSVQGTYESDEEDPLVSKGHSKDHRPDLKQIKLGSIVQQDGLPIFGEVIAGNTSDNKWNLRAVEEADAFFRSKGLENLLYVSDSALISRKNLEKIKGKRFISRLPETFHLANELKEEALSAKLFEEVSDLGQIRQDKKTLYKIYGTEAKIDDIPYRFIVTHSSALKKKKERTIAKLITREEAALSKDARKLGRKDFACHEDAARALDEFVEVAENRGFHVDSSIEKVVTTKYKKRGRPRPGDPKETTVSYKISDCKLSVNQAFFEKLHEMESMFVLISSICDGSFSDVELLKEYKNQIRVEEAFRFIKSPLYLGPVFLNKQSRVKALGYVFMIVLILASYLRYRIHQSLAENNECVIDPGNRKNSRPSLKRIYELLEKVTIVSTPTGELFSSTVDPVVFDIIRWAGFTPEIYLNGYQAQA